MAATFLSVSLTFLTWSLVNGRVVEYMVRDLCAVYAACAAVNGDSNVLDGECSKAKLRDDDAKALRQVCAAILRFADEPISIQKGSHEGAKGRAREMKERMVVCWSSDMEV